MLSSTTVRQGEPTDTTVLVVMVTSLPVFYSCSPNQVHVCFCVFKNLCHLFLPVLQSHLRFIQLFVYFVILLLSEFFEGHAQRSVAILVGERGKIKWTSALKAGFLHSPLEG